jgi:hypothetical protein
VHWGIVASSALLIVLSAGCGRRAPVAPTPDVTQTAMLKGAGLPAGYESIGSCIRIAPEVLAAGRPLAWVDKDALAPPYAEALFTGALSDAGGSWHNVGGVYLTAKWTVSRAEADELHRPRR